MKSRIDHVNYISQDESWESVAVKLYEAKKMRDHYTKLSVSLHRDLLESSDNKNSKFGRFVFHFNYRTGSVDYKKIPQLKNVDVNRYRKDDVRVWKLEVVL